MTREERRLAMGQGFILGVLATAALIAAFALVGCRREKPAAYGLDDFLREHREQWYEPSEAAFYDTFGPFANVAICAGNPNAPYSAEDSTAVYIRYPMSELGTRKLVLYHRRYPSHALAIFHDDPEAGPVLDVIWAGKEGQ